jgi:hypothetical protein
MRSVRTAPSRDPQRKLSGFRPERSQNSEKGMAFGEDGTGKRDTRSRCLLICVFSRTQYYGGRNEFSESCYVSFIGLFPRQWLLRPKSLPSTVLGQTDHFYSCFGLP